MRLLSGQKLLVRQVREMAEWIGIETRNKYQILDESGTLIGYAAEQQKGLMGLLFRQLLGHWRSFEIHFFDHARNLVFVARQPFRLFFQRLEVYDGGGNLTGAIQQRLALLSKRFDVEDGHGQVLLRVSSPFWRIWSFHFTRDGQERASIQKRWSGLFSEWATDRDNFLVDVSDPSLSEAERRLVLAAAVFVDLRYFEVKA